MPSSGVRQAERKCERLAARLAAEEQYNRKVEINRALREAQQHLDGLRAEASASPEHQVKKRVALPGRGTSGGARVLVATNKGGRWFFVFGFEKKDRGNVSATELEALQAIAADLLKLSSVQLDAHVEGDALEELCHDGHE